MAQQKTATDAAQNENTQQQTAADPELAAATLADAAESLQVHYTRAEMREMCRAWELDGYSGTKAEMAATMLEQAEERSLGALAEEGVALTGDLAEDEAEDESEAESEDEGSEGSSGGSSTLTVGDMLALHPEDYHRSNSLAFTEKQAHVLGTAMANPDQDFGTMADTLGCSSRYVKSVCGRWPASTEGIEAVENEGYEVPAEYQFLDESSEGQEGGN